MKPHQVESRAFRTTSCYMSRDIAKHVTFLWPSCDLCPGSLCEGRTRWTWWWLVPSWSSVTAATRPSAGRPGWCRTWAGGCGCVWPASARSTRTGTAGSSTWTSGSAHWAGLWRTSWPWSRPQVTLPVCVCVWTKSRSNIDIY